MKRLKTFPWVEDPVEDPEAVAAELVEVAVAMVLSLEEESVVEEASELEDDIMVLLLIVVVALASWANTEAAAARAVRQMTDRERILKQREWGR